MSTDQLTETTTEVASRDHTLFVAAARWLRNNGWRPDVTTFGTCREMRWRKDADTISVVFAQGVTLRLQGIRGTWLQLDDPADVQRVLDQLVLAHTLPAEFASWTTAPVVGLEPRREEIEGWLQKYHAERWASLKVSHRVRFMKLATRPGKTVAEWEQALDYFAKAVWS